MTPEEIIREAVRALSAGLRASPVGPANATGYRQALGDMLDLADTWALRDYPPKVCANERCGRTFRTQGDDLPQRTRAPRRDAKYCSRRCAHAQAERARRRRAAAA